MDDGSAAMGELLGDVDERIDDGLSRLNSVKARLSDMLWDNDSDELRACLVELNAVIRDQVRVRQDLRTGLPALRAHSDT